MKVLTKTVSEFREWRTGMSPLVLQGSRSLSHAQIIQLNATVAERDVELRKAHLQIKQLNRRLAPKRGQPSMVRLLVHLSTGPDASVYV
jgi:hypothetical protein